MVYFIIAAGIFGMDFVVKKYIDEHTTLDKEENIAGGRLILRNTRNKGIAMGKFPEYTRQITEIMAGVLGAVVVRFIVLLFQKGRTVAKLAYAMIVGGGASNFIDRSTKGFVTDYLIFPVKNKKLRTTVFNISDLFIMAGSVLAAFASIFRSIRQTLASRKAAKKR